MKIPINNHLSKYIKWEMIVGRIHKMGNDCRENS